jgi:virginiamycin B lyase
MIVTEYEVGPGAYGVTLGADGAAWTSLTGRGELARVGPDGQVSQVSLDNAQGEPGAEPHGIALGPGRSVWIALETGTLIHLTESG